MDSGNIAELDEPIKLLKNKDGLFYKLVEKSGSHDYNKIKEYISNIKNE